MNNFVFSGDPLLYNQIVPNSTSITQDIPSYQRVDYKTQLENLNNQYQALQRNMEGQQQPKDLLGEIDGLVKSLDTNTLAELSGNQEFIELNNFIQSSIQEEIMKSVKWKINGNPEIVSKMNRLKELIQTTSKAREEAEKQSLSELNDYIKNYSDMTFNEYKRLKNEVMSSQNN